MEGLIDWDAYPHSTPNTKHTWTVWVRDVSNLGVLLVALDLYFGNRVGVSGVKVEEESWIIRSNLATDQVRETKGTSYFMITDFTRFNNVSNLRPSSELFHRYTAMLLRLSASSFHARLPLGTKLKGGEENAQFN
jgi:hypothetical protein